MARQVSRRTARTNGAHEARIAQAHRAPGRARADRHDKRNGGVARAASLAQRAQAVAVSAPVAMRAADAT
ncbi:hypothetical protein, partial [Burkholderia vietnamiensis]|uniref:hypothetical protein n=1 Tax=Burkholderia vietnamiensis TaxID=60552 RepID=UPI001CC7ED9E